MKAAGLSEPVIKARRFDRRQLQASIGQQADFVARTLRNLGVDDSHLDLAVQKVFLLALRHDPRVEALQDAASLFRAAAKVAEQARRRWPRRHSRHPTKRGKLDSILDTLPEDVREVFVLCELEDRDEAWVASALGHHQSWARTRLRRGHRAVCTKLGVAAPDARKHPRLNQALDGEPLQVLASAREVCASPRARASTLRAIDAVSSLTLLGRLTLIFSRLSLAVLLALVVVLGAALYFVLRGG